MRARRLIRLFLPISFLTASIALCFTATPAVALQTHLFLENLGSANEAKFGRAAGLAVDQSTGDVLVIDADAGTLSRWHADGTPSDFSALGTNAIDGKGTGQCPVVPTDCDQTPHSGFEFGIYSYLFHQVAIDNSGTVTDGNIYLSYYGSAVHVIDIFASSGEYLGQLTAAGATSFTESCGVAVDPSGNVFVSGEYDAIYKFDPSANPPVNADHVATLPTDNPCSLASGSGSSAGSLFAVKSSSPSLVTKLDSTTGAFEYAIFPTITATEGAGYNSVSVDPATGHLYATQPGGPVVEYDVSSSSGATAVSSFAPGHVTIAIDKNSGRIYGTNYLGSHRVRVFGPLVAVPDAVTTDATGIEKTTATLNGTVKPDGAEVTECFFEYGKTTAYGSTIPCAESPASLGTGKSPASVHADISGLELGATYHFRLVAGNVNGETKGADKSFRLKGPPVIAGAWAEDVGLRDARLKGLVNPSGVPTTYHFEWGPTAAYGNSTPINAIGSSKVDQLAAAFLEGLEPGTTYHFRLLATNEIGADATADDTFTTFKVPTDSESCPNDALRGGPSSRLPDCRAYEMVSPLDKNGGDILAIDPTFPGQLPPAFKQGSVDGERITYSAGAAFADAVSSSISNQYISSRDADGWSTHGISPPMGIGLSEGKGQALPLLSWGGGEALFEGFTPDLCSAWVRSENVEPLTPDGLEGFGNLYRRADCGAQGYEALTNEGPFGPTSPYLNDFLEFTGGEGPGVRLHGFSQDLSHQIFSSSARLSLSAPGGKKSRLYDLHEGKLELVSVLPNGKPNPDNSYAGMSYNPCCNRQGNMDHVVSTDGSRIFWTSQSKAAARGPGKLYVRIDGKETIAVSATAEGLSGAETSFFWTAAADGSAALFSVGGFGNVYQADDADVYEFDVETKATRLIAGDSPGVLGASDDLSRIYFVSTEDLAEGAAAGEWNLYLEEEGTIDLVTTLSDEDAEVHNFGGISPIMPSSAFRVSNVSPDGRHIAFQAMGSLTGYDNVDPVTGKRFAEVFHYDAEADELHCVSCNPSGARPAGPSLLRPYFVVDTPVEGNVGFRAKYGEAANLPTCERELHCARVLSADGQRLFFHSFEALVVGDTNGVEDVYQWEAPGSGSCETDDGNYYLQNGGCISLISTGTSPQKSEFYDASADGEDVFFATSSSIDPRDEGLIDVYDARVGGGFPIPIAPPECVGDACQAVPAPPTDPTPASSSFQGAGDPKPAKPRRRCRARGRKAGKARSQAKRRAAGKAKSQAKRKAIKRRCRRAKRGGAR